MNAIRIAVAAFGALAIAGSASAASLAGDTIQINLVSNGVNYGSKIAVVGPDNAGHDIDYFGNQLIDLNAGVDGDLFTISSITNFCGLGTCTGIATWTLSSLDFGAPLTGFSILQSHASVTIDSLTATSVTFSYAETDIPRGLYFQARFETGGGGGVVPEPSTWALLIAGFGLAGGALRARRSQTAAG